jgi:hypothetical protein
VSGRSGLSQRRGLETLAMLQGAVPESGAISNPRGRNRSSLSQKILYPGHWIELW